MKISDAGKDIIKQHEGLRLTAYLCPADKWTIGWGHTLNVNKSGALVDGVRTKTITLAQAEAFLSSDLSGAEHTVNTLVKVDLNQHQFDALVSLVFNIGSGAFRKSTLLQKLNEGKYSEAAKQFKRWNKATVNKELVVLSGLTKRRRQESELFQKPLVKSRTIAGQVTTGVGVGGMEGLEALQTQLQGHTEQLQVLIQYHEYFQYAFSAMMILGIALTVYAAIDRRRKGVE